MNTEIEGNRWHELRLAGQLTSDYSGFFRLCRQRARQLKELDIRRRKYIRLALLGSANTDFLADMLEFSLDIHGIGCEIIEAPFNTYAYQMLNADSLVAKFRPDVAVFVGAALNQPEWPDINTPDEEVEIMAGRVAGYWLDLCRALHDNTGCEIVFDNFSQLSWKPNGNLSARHAADHNNYLTRINCLIGRNAPPYLHINDVAWMSSYHGVSNWFDTRYWHHAKLPVSFGCIVPYVRNISGIIAALYGGSRKVLVLDLDNTLWGGVVGDDGVDSIRIGHGSPEGEAFLYFQRYILQLKNRGVLLAVCSKNDDSGARAPFTDHPEMILGLDDFACFVANWEPKPDNLVTIAEQLNLGLDSFVFVDDNPAERELMRRQLPDVLTIELGDDPAGFPAQIDEQSPFEVVSLSREDAMRTNQYRENQLRESLRTAVSSYNDYLVSLEQRAIIRCFDESRLDRITQLINKTNQFNLTTRRKTRAEVERLMQDEKYLSVYIQLADRFGDNGVIAVVFGCWGDDCLEVDDWLMSCRVLKRDIEKLTCNYLAEQVARKGRRYIYGNYIPTDRNGMVVDHYPDLGFEQVRKHENGETRWRLDVATYVPAVHSIAIEES